MTNVAQNYVYANNFNSSNSFLPTFKLPLSVIAYTKPDEEITEAEKFANGCEWFFRMNRWVTYNFFNPVLPSFYNNSTTTTRSCDNMVEMFAYYFGTQENRTFSYTETINENDTIQAVYVPDQKIRALIDPMIGSAIKVIAPMKDSISVKVLSQDAIKGREELRRKLQIKKQLKDLMASAQGVSFSPSGADVDEDEDIDDVVDKFKNEEELKLIKAAQALFFGNRLAKKFEDSAYHEFVNNVSSFIVQPSNGETDVQFTPCYNAIIDTRATDSFLSDALLSGFVEFLSPAEIFAKWGSELNDDERNHINRLSQKQYANWQECYAYYNYGCNNVLWLCQQTGKISCATTFWIGKKDLRYRRKEDQFGQTHIQMLDDDKLYAVTDENGKPLKDDKGAHVHKKGSEIKGDTTNWFVHVSTNIGNIYIKNCGYHPIQIRPMGQRQKPMLPTVQFVHRMTMGYYRSLVSRLRHYSEEKGRLKLKIQELTGRDMGKVYALFADKLGLSESEAEEIFKDFKTMGFTLINRSGDDPNENGKIGADVLDFSLSPSISAYIQLCREQDREMEIMCSTSELALGQQTNVVGKGVQENSIAQSTLGQLSLFDGLYEHWTQVLRYALNVEKFLKAGKESIIQTSANSAFLLNLNKNLRNEDIGLYVEPSDTIEGQEKKVLNDGLFALAQNGGTLEATEALLNTMHLIRFNSAAEGIRHLEKFVEKKKKEVAAQVQQGQEAEAQQKTIEVTLAKLFEEKMQESKDLNANYRAEVTAVMAAISKMHGDIEKSSTAILTALSAQQPATPVAQDIASSQQQPPGGGPPQQMPQQQPAAAPAQ